MYLLPTEKELAFLRSQIDPKQRFLRAARAAIDEACELGDSMGGFYFDSQDVDMIMEDDAMPYFDEIEDDIISMKRDINGFRVPAPRYMEYARGTDSVNYKGKTFEYITNNKVPDGPNLKRVSSWDEI